MVNGPSARISNNHSPTYPHIHTFMLLYLWHCFKNVFLWSEDNVNRGTRERGRQLEKDGEKGALQARFSMNNSFNRNLYLMYLN